MRPGEDVLGVGIDVEERTALDHLDENALAGAARRWLTPAEHAWCAAQPCRRTALLVALCCKEAAYKAWSAPGAVHEVVLELRGCVEEGRAVAGASGAPRVEVTWRMEGSRVIATAAAGSATGTAAVLAAAGAP